jgi:putative membrane protein
MRSGYAIFALGLLGLYGVATAVAGRLPFVHLLERREVMDWITTHVRAVFDSVLYAVLGTVVLCVAFWIIEKVLPFSITKEIAEDQNVGLGIILGAFVIGISVIIAAAIH